ncbi:hypothetical protein F-LCD7_0010 [Faustovirus]|nr:hypothetical protein F-LCD7_0010 [Faustovirus]
MNHMLIDNIIGAIMDTIMEHELMPVTLPMEIWGEIAEYGFGIWRAVRSLDRQLYGALTVANAIGKFDHAREGYVYTSEDRVYDFFRRLYIISLGSQVVLYKTGLLTIITHYARSEYDDVWHITSKIRTLRQKHDDTNGAYKVMIENCTYNADGMITCCSRLIKIGAKTVHGDHYYPATGRIYYNTPYHEEWEFVHRDNYAKFRINDAFFLYNCMSIY